MEDYSEPYQTSKMERFAEIVNEFFCRMLHLKDLGSENSTEICRKKCTPTIDTTFRILRYFPYLEILVNQSVKPLD